MKKIKCKLKTLVALLSLVFCLFSNVATAQNKAVVNNDLRQPSISQWNQEFVEGDYTVTITKLETEGFGYQILNKDKTIIYQESLPFIVIPFTKIENAKIIAKWHINNIKPDKTGKIPFDIQKALQLGVSPTELK